jgi:hypothetical protein
MKSKEKIRMIHYLERRYHSLSARTQNKKLEEIIERLAENPEYLDRDDLVQIAESLLEEGWSLPKVIAHLDIMDMEERT